MPWKPTGMSDARYIVGDVLQVLATLPDNSVDLVLTSPQLRRSARCAKRLTSLPAVECLHLVSDLSHPSSHFWPAHGSTPPCAPRLDVGLGDEDSPPLPNERDVFELHRLHACGVTPPSPFTRFCKWEQSLTLYNIRDDEGATTRASVDVAEFECKVGLSRFDAQEWSECFEYPPTRGAMDLPDVDWSGAPTSVVLVDIGMPAKRLRENLNRLWVELLHRASRLVGGLLRVACRPHLVPVHMDPYVSVGVQHASHVSEV